MKTKLIIIALLTTAFASAQNIFQDDFAAYSTDADLNNQGTWTNNSSNPGGLGAAVGAIPNNADVVATAIAYPNYGTSSNAVKISADSDGCGTAFPAVTSGDLYVGFVLNLSNAQANNNSDFFRVMSGNNLNTTFRLYATPAPGAFFIGVAKGANGNQINFTSNALGYNQDHLIVIKYTQGAGTNDDVISVYVDPVYANGAPGTATITNNVGLDQSGNLDRLAFRQNWTNGMPTGKLGLVSVARTWDDLKFVPLATNQFHTDNRVWIDSENAKSGVISIVSEKELGSSLVQIYSLTGSLVDEKRVSVGKGKSDLHIIPLRSSSVYIIKVTDSQNQPYTTKIQLR
jgi:hypothetical protein